MSYSSNGVPATTEISYGTSLAEVSDVLFAELKRRDQRERAVQYVRGLLEVSGRKSIRNIAAQLGDPAAEQRLHHFVTSSPWDWKEIRSGLATYIDRQFEPAAWVVRPMIIPKSGTSSIGVDRRYFPAAGQVLSAQHAIGVWSASDEVSCPVNWRLQLSEKWLTDGARRAAAIPSDMTVETVERCVVAACRDVAAVGRPKPFVVDVPGMDLVTVAGMFARSRLPVLMRIGGSTRLAVVDAALAGYESDTHPALQIMRASRSRVRPVTVHRPDGPPIVDLAAGVRVRVPDPGRAAARPWLLLGGGQAGGTWPSDLWLTNMTDVAPESLLRLAGLGRQVDHDLAEITEDVGIRDFAGRSFGGWHRHATLTSAAHVVAAQTMASLPANRRGALGCVA